MVRFDWANVGETIRSAINQEDGFFLKLLMGKKEKEQDKRERKRMEKEEKGRLKRM